MIGQPLQLNKSFRVKDLLIRNQETTVVLWGKTEELLKDSMDLLISINSLDEYSIKSRTIEREEKNHEILFPSDLGPMTEECFFLVMIILIFYPNYGEKLWGIKLNRRTYYAFKVIMESGEFVTFELSWADREFGLDSYLDSQCIFWTHEHQELIYLERKV